MDGSQGERFPHPQVTFEEYSGRRDVSVNTRRVWSKETPTSLTRFALLKIFGSNPESVTNFCTSSPEARPRPMILFDGTTARLRETSRTLVRWPRGSGSFSSKHQLHPPVKAPTRMGNRKSFGHVYFVGIVRQRPSMYSNPGVGGTANTSRISGT